MDVAILAAEREAAEAARNASKAHEQLVEWTEGEKTVISQLKKIGAVIQSPALASVSNGFIQQHNTSFEFSDENKLEHTALHEQFVELMEKTIFELAPDIDMDSLLTNLPEFMEARAHSRDPEGTGETIDFLLSLTDFNVFKQTMLASKHDPSVGLALTDAKASADAALGALAGALRMDPALVQRANVLLQLGEQSGENATVAWRRIGEKAGTYTIDTTELGADRFMRTNVVMRLSLEHALAAHCNWADPDLLKYDDMMAHKVDVLRDVTEGSVHDYVTRMHLRLPGMIKFVPGLPKTMVMRAAVERDAPRPGAAVVIWTGWDAECDCADEGPNGWVRVAVLEDMGNDVTSFINVSRMPPVFPTWVASIFFSKTIISNMLTTTQKYKQFKRL